MAFKLPFKLDFNLDKIFGKIKRKDMKKNILVDIGLYLRHLIIQHKTTAYTILAIIGVLIIATPIYLKNYYDKVNEANTYFEYGLGAYRKALSDPELSPEERANQMGESIKRFQYVINQFSNTPPAADALFYQGHAYYDLGDYNNALNKYQEYYDRYSKKYFADLALLNVGRCNEQLNNFQGAVQAYQKIIHEYPKGTAKAEALFQLGKIHELSNAINQAFQYYNQLINEHPQSPWAREARMRVLFIQSQVRPEAKPIPEGK
ncbi:MAG: tetratricopeptide repeat protein [Spirochaetes bacterium]|nr:tetratricopeptide repeat protein [Spirochaetota bacterium]